MAISTPEAQKLTRSVYASVAILRQYPGPSTNRRYAEIPIAGAGGGLFEWQLGSDSADDGVTVIRPGSGAYGAWHRTVSFASLTADIAALDARVDDLEADPVLEPRPYAPQPTLTSASVDPADLDLVVAIE
mgnify:FL=1